MTSRYVRMSLFLMEACKEIRKSRQSTVCTTKKKLDINLFRHLSNTNKAKVNAHREQDVKFIEIVAVIGKN